MKWRKKSLHKWTDSSLQEISLQGYSSGRHWIKMTLFSIGVLFIIFGIANLQFGSKLAEGKSEGIELMIALDVSNSMLAEDLQPNRLKHAKRAITKLIDQLHGDQIGIVVFAGQAYVQLPITTDYGAARTFLNSVNPGIIPTQGTSFKAAIEKSMSAFRSESGANKAIVIITDGENHEEGSEEAAEEAFDQGVRVFTLGMGSEQGVPIPLYKGKTKQGFLKDSQGNTVISALNPQVLASLANKGGGKYLAASNTQESLNMLFNELQQMETQEFETKMFMDYEDRFQYFLFAGLFFLIISQLILERKSTWGKKWLE